MVSIKRWSFVGGDLRHARQPFNLSINVWSLLSSLCHLQLLKRFINEGVKQQKGTSAIHVIRTLLYLNFDAAMNFNFCC